jgi:hypothetical protein
MASRRIGDRLRGLLGRHDQPEVEVEATRPCPHCRQPISRGATVCIHCEREIAPVMSFGEFARRFGSPHSGGPPPMKPEQ